MHAAARVMAEAVGGQILISDEVRKHAEPELDWPFLDSGLFWLRGFPGALAAVRGVLERRRSGCPAERHVQRGLRRSSSGMQSEPACDGSWTGAGRAWRSRR